MYHFYHRFEARNPLVEQARISMLERIDTYFILVTKLYVKAGI